MPRSHPTAGRWTTSIRPAATRRDRRYSRHGVANATRLVRRRLVHRRVRQVPRRTRAAGAGHRQQSTVFLRAADRTRAAIASHLRSTGKDTDHAAVRASLVRLRQGSEGEPVRRLQAVLGLPVDGRLGAVAKKALAEMQRRRSGEFAGDGVYSPALDAVWGLDVFGEAGAPPSRRRHRWWSPAPRPARCAKAHRSCS